MQYLQYSIYFCSPCLSLAFSLYKNGLVKSKTLVISFSLVTLLLTHFETECNVNSYLCKDDNI